MFELEHPILKHKKKGNGSEYNKRSHTICHCKHDYHLLNGIGSHIVWNRDYNAARNILNVMKMKLLGKNLGYFSRSIKKERIYDTNKKALFTQIEDSLLNEMSFSLEKQGASRKT